MATCAQITGATVPPNAGEDSVSILPALKGQAAKPLREATVHHSIQGKFAIRRDRWKLALCPGSGGWTAPNDKAAASQGLPALQLYDLAADPEERTNLQARRPKETRQLTGLLAQYVSRGRSTPGPRQNNDVAVDVWKKLESNRKTGSD
jgi:arylsulfatase A-like enzyme